MPPLLRKKVALTFWLIGGAGATLFTLFWISAIVYTRRVSLAALAVVGFGGLLTYDALRAWKEEKKYPKVMPQARNDEKQTSTLWHALLSCNVAVLAVAGFLILRHVNRTTVYETVSLLLIVMNAYLFLAFWMWGSKTD